MKKARFLLFTALLLFNPFILLHGSGIDILSHQSAEFYSGLSRNASTDGADIVNYNPAGTAFLDDGLYLSGSLQAILATYDQEYMGTRHRDREPIFMPSIFLVYKREKWAGFFSFTVPGGSGTVRYSNGIGYIRNQIELLALQLNFLAGGGVSPLPILNQDFEATNAIFALSFGGAYRCNDVVSLSLKARYFSSNKEAMVSYDGLIPYDLGSGPGALVLSSDVEYLATGHGAGGVIGIDVRPVHGLTLALTVYSPGFIRYDYGHYSNSTFCFDTRTGVDSLAALGVEAPVFLLLWSKGEAEKKNTDYMMPPMLLFGAEYTIDEKYTLSTSWAVYLNSLAKWNGLDRDVDTGWEGSLAFQVALTPSIRLGIGGAYSSSGITSKALDRMSQAANPSLDHWSVGAGARVRATDRLDLSFGACCSIYTPLDGTYGLIRYERMGYGVAIGAQYKWI